MVEKNEMAGVPFNDLSRAASAQSAVLETAARRVIESGWFVHGPEHRVFEKTFAGYLGVSDVLGVASGTDALELAMRAVATPARRTILTVANAGGYTTCAAIAAGLDVEYIDIESHSHLISLDSLELHLHEGIAAVVVTHTYGRVADVEAVRVLCEPFGTVVIEDCAQSAGAGPGDRMSGSLGHIGTFSFYPTKNLGALGDGGAVSTSDAELAERLRHLRQYGWSSKYQNSTPGGRNSRLDEMQAAFLNRRLPHLLSGNERRREIIGRYGEAAPTNTRVLAAFDRTHSGHLAVVETADASKLRDHLLAKGISSEVHYPIPDHWQDAFPSALVRLPVTESKVGRVLSLPCFPELTEDEIYRVCEALSHYEKESAP